MATGSTVKKRTLVPRRTVKESVKTEDGWHGRTRVKIDPQVVRGLAAISCTIGEIAGMYQISERHLLRRIEKDPGLRKALDLGRTECKVSIRRQQFRHMKMPNSAGVNMTVHVSEQLLGQTKKAALELAGKDGGPVQVVFLREDAEL